MHFGGSSPVAEFIGARTLELLASPNRIESYIVQDGLERRKLGFSGCTVLAKGPTLDELQIARLRECVLTPQSHYDGNPIFRRLPPKPNFAFRVWRDERVLDILVDLHNPGWEFYCGAEIYRNWNWVGGELAGLAKELFPQFASPSSKAIWQKGAIKTLQDEARYEF